MPTPSPDATPRMYRTARGYRIFLYLSAPPLILVLLTLPFLLMQGANPSLTVSVGFGVLGLGLGSLLSYNLLETVRSEVLLGEKSISQTGAFKTKTLLLDQIAGYRTNDKYTRIIPQDPSLPTLKISENLAHFEELRSWLAAYYPDLDQFDTQQSTAALLESHNLGQNLEEREETLKQSQRLAQILNLVGQAVGLWLAVFPKPYFWAVSAGLGWPVVAVIALLLRPHSLRPDQLKNNNHPSVFYALLGPAFGLLILSLSDHSHKLISHIPLWPWVGIIATMTVLVLAIGGRYTLFQRESFIGPALTITILAALYGYGSVYSLNIAFDTSEAIVFKPLVLEKRLSSPAEESKSYYLTLTPWGPMRTTREVDVLPADYDLMHEGEPATVLLRPGRLGVPWFVVTK